MIDLAWMQAQPEYRRFMSVIEGLLDAEHEAAGDAAEARRLGVDVAALEALTGVKMRPYTKHMAALREIGAVHYLRLAQPKLWARLNAALVQMHARNKERAA